MGTSAAQTMVAAARNSMSTSFITKDEVGTQERNTAISISLFLTRDCKSRANSLTLQITTYEINNTPLPQQYRRWMHSTVNQLRQHADHHAKQREYARSLWI